jgi:chemotaxis protein methyltransferase WspC
MTAPPPSPTVEQLLGRWIGLDPTTIGTTAIDRAVRLRMAAVAAADRDAYVARIAGDREERDRLIDEVVVPESWFFRDEAVFDDLRLLAAARRDGPHLPPLTILCAPCAAGEEPYSVAITLLDAGLAAERFRIDAFDVSRQALGRAVAGRYSANAFRTPDLGFRDRWFQSDGTMAVLDERLRSRVGFAWGNLLDPGFCAGRGPYDVVLCRNLLIYLDMDSRRQVERTCDRLLAADGLLVVGAAEPAMLAGCWATAGVGSSFVLRRVTTAPTSAAKGVSTARPPATVPAAKVPADAGGRQRAPITAAAPTDPEAALRAARALGESGRIAEAIECCRRAVATAPTAPGFFLLAMLERRVGAVDQAEGCLHKALYLDPDRADALLELALIADERGDRTMADRYRHSAARVLARKGEA